MRSAKARTSSRIASASGGRSTALARRTPAAGEVGDVGGGRLGVEERQRSAVARRR